MLPLHDPTRCLALLAVAAALASLLAAQSPASAGRTHAAIDRRADSLLACLTLEEKVALISGIDYFDIPGNARIGLPRLGTADGPFGIRARGPSTIYPGGIALAATWDVALAERVGAEIGRDARARGKQYALAPGVNMYRTPLNGRNFEYFGEDPWLASRLAVAFVRGVQAQGVSATIKHFVGNEAEYLRHTSDSRIDERTLRELYLPPFEAAVREADVGAIMPSYNLTNGVQMTANRRLLLDVAKREWGFRGVMMSDWTAVHGTAAAANGGTDLEMPGQQYFVPDSLLPLVRSGVVAESTIDEKVRRLLRNAIRFGWMEGAAPDVAIPRYNAAGRQVALQAAREALVLLRNERGLLPLQRDRIRTVAVIGPNALPAVPLAGGSATLQPFHASSVVEGLADALGPGVRVRQARGLPTLAQMAQATAFTQQPGGQPGVVVEVFADDRFVGRPAATRVEQSMSVGRPLDIIGLLASEDPLDLAAIAAQAPIPAMRLRGWYTATRGGVHHVFVQQGGFGGSGVRLRVDGRVVHDSWDMATAAVGQAEVTLAEGRHEVVAEYRARPGGFGPPFVRVGIAPADAWVDPAAVRLAAESDVVVLAVGFDPQSEGEGWDRTFELPPGQDALIRRVAAANLNTVVALTSGGGTDMRAWLDSVTAVVQTWYTGEMGGRALAEVLLGDVNPSGRLPATFERRLADNPAMASYYPTTGPLRVPYAEGVFTGYRGFDRSGLAPLFPFGFGLSYTSFAFEDLHLSRDPASRETDPRWTAAFTVRNTGERAGTVVAQLYVGGAPARVPRPEKELKGFARVELRPGESRRVVLPLDLRSLAYYDAPGRRWRADAGTYRVRVGSSSADLPLTAPLRLKRTVSRALEP